MSARRSVLVALARAGGCVIAAAVAAVSGPVEPPPPASPAAAVVVFSGPAPRGRYSVRVVMPPGDPAADDRVRTAIAREVSRTEGVLSRSDAASAVSRFNAHASTDPFPVPVELVEVAFTARRVAEATGGAFDPTGAPRGFELLAIQPAGLPLAKARADLGLDLDALAGGWLADRIATAIVALGRPRRAGDVGGEVAGRGRRPDGSRWHVAVARGAPGEARIVALDGVSIATAADDPGPAAAAPRPGRIADPRTGLPVPHALVSATVVHPGGATAGAFARALLVLGPADGRTVVERERLAARLVERRPDGSESEWSSPPFAAGLVN